MYESHFGLNARPFSKTPDPRFFFESRGHAEAMARLLYAIEEREIGLLTGGVGTGKTTLCRTLIDALDERYRVALVVNPRLSASQYIALIADRFGVTESAANKVKLFDALTTRLYEMYTQGKRALVIVDEAQLIPQKSVFEELRLLTNVQLDDAGLLSLVLIGQPELNKKLERAAYQNFAQRIGMAFHLSALDETETRRYVAHRLSVAGAAPGLFSDDALTLVFAGSEGIPRRINTVCQGALLVAFGAQAQRVSADHVADVLADLQLHLGGVFKSTGQASAVR